MSNRFPADDEHLHPYPGNLKHHKVSKEEQRKLLSEMMADDAKSGMYDTAEHKPIVSNETIRKWSEGVSFAECVAEEVRDVYETHIANGKLRVVEEVESYHEILFGCPSCNSVWHKQPRWSQNGKIKTMHYCPGCGNKIKR